MILEPIQKQTVADAVYERIRDQIVMGRIAPGTELPGERNLSETLEVNRGAVREALKRLEQARLISIRQGGATRVLDFRATATLELVTRLLITAQGGLDVQVARSVVELRVAIEPDIARLATIRGGPELAGRLAAVLAEMRAAHDDMDRLQDLVEDFWQILTVASGNIAYQLINNTIREAHDRCKEFLAPVLESPYRDNSHLEEITEAVERQDPEGAERGARRRAALFAEVLQKAIGGLGAEAPARPPDSLETREEPR